MMTFARRRVRRRMSMNLRRLQWLVLAALTSCFLSTSFLVAADNPSAEPKLTLEQEEEFLLHAKVIKSHQTSKGVTAPWRLTLTDGTITHDAVFQPVDERKNVMAYGDGRTEINLKDAKDLVMCERSLLDKLRKLDEDDVMEKTKGQLTKGEVKALMARRDKIVKTFDNMVAEKGEGAVLY